MTTPIVNEFPNLSLIREGINFRFTVRLGKLELLMRPLSTFEEDAINQEVIDAMKRLPVENQTSLKQSALTSVKRLAKAQTSDVTAKDGKMNEMELSNCTPAELQFLAKEYNAGCEKVNPRLQQFSKEEVIHWVESLKKNTQNQETTLIESSFYQLVALCTHLLTASELPVDNLPG
jgi:hypothetical protein